MTDERQDRGILDLMTQGVIETTPEGAILTVNLAFARLLGYESPEELMSSVSRAADLYADAGERPAQVDRARRGHTDASHALEVRCKDGSRMWIHAKAVPTVAPDGTLVRMTGILDGVDDHPLTQRALNDAVLRVEARERMLIAETIHDEPLQLIAAAVLRLDSLQRQVSDPTSAALEQVVSLLQRSTDQLRRLIMSLSPPDLGGGLGPALAALAEGVFIDGTMEIEVRGPHDVPLAASTKTVVYLVLREALINVHKHAEAHRVIIELDAQASVVVVSITDDGRGAEAVSAGPGHLGVRTMRDRIASIGADLDITSAPGRGTTVTVRVPRRAGE